jgi:hypothetical protein
MPWVRIDDELFTHPKFNHAWESEPASVGLWLFGASHSSHHLLDGLVPKRFVRQWFTSTGRQRRTTHALEDSNLWVPTDRGWEMHDWAQYNPTRQEVLAKRAADSARKRTGIR